MNKITAIILAILLSSMGTVLSTGSFAISAPPPESLKSIPSGYSSEEINVRFRKDTDVDDPDKLLPAELMDSVKKIEPYFTLPKSKLKELKEKGEKLSKKELPDLSLWFAITLKKGVDAADFIEKLRQLDNVEIVEPAPLPAPPPAVTPDFTDKQGYLKPAPGGIDAYFSWNFEGGSGKSIKIYDVEYSWNQTHEDLFLVHELPLLLKPGYSAVDPFNDNNHGTAVLGELIADKDNKGVTGISWGANIGLAPTRTKDLQGVERYRPADAINLSAGDGLKGDVILIEQQICVCNLICDANTQAGYGPLEWVQSVYDAIKTAVANGFVVVEAAGNGNVNLDQRDCGDTFNRAKRDSGAIIVGAGQSPATGHPREREWFSSYGSRVDVQGWGDSVATTGYDGSRCKGGPNAWHPCISNADCPGAPGICSGVPLTCSDGVNIGKACGSDGDCPYLCENNVGYDNPDDIFNQDFWYTFSFGGTSSASPIVAGAAANLQGISLVKCGEPLAPDRIRQLLVQTGSPQRGNLAQHIGPLPDLKRAIPVIRPRISGRIINQGWLDGLFFVDLMLTNEMCNAENVQINQLPLRTLVGLGAVTYSYGLVSNNPVPVYLPIPIGDLDAWASTTIRLFFYVPFTVFRFSITENGTLQDLRTNYSFSIGQAVIPW
ncbi:exported hypothetical protein [Candidatus Sulfobium mesophilum]|uniref:Peptidase S8/S53 domain-containing protein n=1 Tax=Candidatus Sulfobium mesophilum TaxID=2016548 RepID=A0A2U3QKV9_9BACT|nr:exported hypothetical protein [Candidatus Sulfobium mesophilum]